MLQRHFISYFVLAILLEVVLGFHGRNSDFVQAPLPQQAPKEKNADLHGQVYAIDGIVELY